MAIPPLLAPVQRSGHVQERRRARGTDAGGIAVENNGHLQGEKIEVSMGKITIFNGKISIFNGKISIFNGNLLEFR